MFFGNKVLPNKCKSKAGRRAMGSRRTHITSNLILERGPGQNDLG